MAQYRCRECGEYFDEPQRWVETHGFTDGLYENWSSCPHCDSTNYDYSYIVDREFEEVDDEEVDDE